MKQLTVNRKREIINAATTSFSLYGYKNTTMDQVARLANVGKGTIYTFFKNKEELFNYIVTTLIEDMEYAAKESIDVSKSFRENVHHALFKMLEYRKEHQLIIKLFQEKRDLGTPAVQTMMQKFEESILTFIRNKVEKAIERNEIKECNSELTAFVIFKLYIALIFDWEKSREPLSKERIAHLFELYLFTGLSR